MNRRLQLVQGQQTSKVKTPPIKDTDIHWENLYSASSKGRGGTRGALIGTKARIRKETADMTIRINQRTWHNPFNHRSITESTKEENRLNLGSLYHSLALKKFSQL